MTPQARAMRERLAGLCAAHGFTLVSQRRIAGGQYSVTIARGEGEWRVVDSLSRVYEHVLAQIDAVQAIDRIKAGETSVMDEIARILR
jgi:hypothetical protein